MNDGVYTYTFNHANQLVGVSGAGTTVSYAYNGEGDRVSQTAGITTTTYTLDLAAGLTQVLSDGTDSYLYGNGRIAQYDASGAQYFLGDAPSTGLRAGLGSVRQLADANGEVLLTQNYEPFGDVLDSAGEGVSSYGFTAEMRDPTGLIYLRARYYSSATGRFLTKDSWQGNYSRPLSLAQWTYAEANPVNRVDPTGKYTDPFRNSFAYIDEEDYRDLTDWLYRAMIQNANDPTIRKLRQWNQIAYGWSGIGLATCGVGVVAGQPIVAIAGGIVIGGGVVFHSTALYEYSQLVKDGAIWDFKDETGLKLGPGITLCSTGACKKDVEFSVPGNIHFAYLGGAAGIFGVEVQAGAGWAEINDPAHDPESKQYTGPWEGEWNLFNPLLEPWQWNFGDEPKDHKAVTFGIYLWKNYQSRLMLSDFKRELASHINLFATCKPDSDAVPADVAARWPYPVDEFNNKGESFILKQGRCP